MATVLPLAMLAERADKLTVCMCTLQGNMVRMTTTGSVSVGQLLANGRDLIISSLSQGLLGDYSCTASNARGTSILVVSVFGPPPAPTGIPMVETDGSQFTIHWSRPSSPDTVITGYQITIYKSVLET